MKESNTMQEYWNNVYNVSDIKKLGWFEENPEKSIMLFEKCSLRKDDLILDIGSGTSNFIDYLLVQKYTNVVALDISDLALEKKKKLLRDKELNYDGVIWVVGDIRDSKSLLGKINNNIQLWHDRAVLHFLKSEEERQKYKENLFKSVKIGGFAIIAVFAKDGAKKCSGLELLNYSIDDLSNFLGPNFRLLESFHHTYIQPSGSPRPFVYTLFQRIKD